MEYTIETSQMPQFVGALKSVAQELMMSSRVAFSYGDMEAGVRDQLEAQMYYQAIRDLHTMEGPDDADEISGVQSETE